MTQCWSEGALRAYLDRELPAEEIQRAAAHLKQCTVCEGLCRELAGRASRVSALLDLLPELENETLHVPARMPRRASGLGRVGWVGASVALAAGLGVVAYFAPERKAPVTMVASPPPVVSLPADTGLETAPVRVPAMSVHSARAATRPAKKPVLDAGDFVALDDEPFESGLIMRVAAGKAQADIVFGADGRARAFRLVKAPKQKF
jgi:hypothetical protein